MRWSADAPVAGTAATAGLQSAASSLPARVLRSLRLARLVRSPAPRLLVAMAIVVLGCAAASTGDQSRIGRWGLIQALPPSYFACVAALTVCFVVEVFRPSSSGLVLAAQVAGLALLLHGAPNFVETEPRFATAWLHAGFTEQILDTGAAAPTVDARFSWPGFFGAAAAVTGAGGLHSAVPLLRWAPLAWLFVYLPPIYVIGTFLTRSAAAAWLGLWLFVLANWIGQDYFAPQSLGFVLYLMAVAIIVSFFRGGPQLPLGGRLSGWRDRLPQDGFSDLPASRELRGTLVVLLVLLQAALAATHQLSPIVLVLASAALVLVGRCRLLVFPVIAGVLALGWISIGAEPYWVGHLGTIFGGVGNVGEVVDRSVVQRVAGSDVHRALVVLRLGFTAAVWGLALLSALVLWARRPPPLTLIALTAAPFALVVQNYGSEGVLRMYLFSAPFACLLIAQLIVTLVQPPGRTQVGRSARVRLRTSRGLVGGVALALVPLFLVTRYGNESFEQVRPTELHAIQVLYSIAPQGSWLVSPTSQVPWRYDFATVYHYVRPDDAQGFMRADPAAVRRLVGGPHGRTPTYLLVTRGQLIYASQAYGLPDNWFGGVRRLLTPANGYRLVYRNQDAFIYRYQAP